MGGMVRQDMLNDGGSDVGRARFDLGLKRFGAVQQINGMEVYRIRVYTSTNTRYFTVRTRTRVPGTVPGTTTETRAR